MSLQLIMALTSFTQRIDSKTEEAFRRRRSTVILTPLVDVVFILLVFFMLVSNFNDNRIINMLTPTAAKEATSEQSLGVVLIRIGRDGALNISGLPTTEVKLAQEVALRSVGDTKYSYLVQPDVGVSLQEVVSIVDLLKVSGAHSVALTRKPGYEN